MPRVLSVYLPLWPTERYARRHRLRKGQPVLLFVPNAGRELVVHASAEALAVGVRAGMTLSHARALLRHAPIVDDAEPENDKAGLAALARFVSRRWTPTVSADPPDGFLCDIAGCEHLFGGERQLVRSLVRALRSLGLTVRTAIAQTVGAAWPLARYGSQPHASVAAGSEKDAIASLPVEGLRLSGEVVESLREVNVERVGQLLALPRSALPARYGHEVLLRIDQALGTAFEPVLRVAEESAFVSCITLDGGTTHLESVELAVRETLAALCQQLDQRESGLRRLHAVFKRVDAEDIEIVVQVSRPTRDIKHLWTLLRPKLERLHLGYGIEHVTLSAELVVGIPHAQSVFKNMNRGRESEVAGDAAEFSAMLDTIANRVGMDRVQRPLLIESHRPERASAFVPFMQRERPKPKVRTTMSPLHRPRPSRLLAQPVPIHVTALSPDGPVLQLAFNAEATGRASVRTITTSIGPERLSGEWWRWRESARDYFRVQDETGQWLWIFRDSRSGAWFIHGEWA